MLNMSFKTSLLSPPKMRIGGILFFITFVFHPYASATSWGLPVIFALSGSELSDDEKAFMEEYPPVGVILSRWNYEVDGQGNVNGEKLRQLCDAIHVYSPHILIDQEGGRVQHLRGTNCYRASAPGTFAEGVTEEILEEKREALRQNVRAIDGDLVELGFDVNCAPLCDLLSEGIPSFIGDRSFGINPRVVCDLAREWVKQAAADGIISVLKHCPGHGSAVGDSHKALPRVEKSLPDLEGSDFKIFGEVIRTLYEDDGIDEDSFWVMTAHVLYPAIDPDHCATQSQKINRMIRDRFGHRGKIVSDCVMMQALEGEPWKRAIGALEAGCDYVICVNHDLEQKKIIAEKVTEYLAAKGEEI
jgi:beta-glucosidase-like glycosyl hydrolase